MSYTLGLQLEIPIGNRQARAIDQRALLQRQQAITQYEANLKQIAMEVKQALRDVRDDLERDGADRPGTLRRRRFARRPSAA